MHASRVALVGLFVLSSHLSVARAEEVLPERAPRMGIEFHRTFGGKNAEKRQGMGPGLVVLVPLPDSGFDLGVRYFHIHEDARRRTGGQTENHTGLTFVCDFYFWRSKLPGAFVGGELGFTDPAANNFFSFYSDYLFVGKFGYEQAVTRKWSATFEFRRAFRDENPLKPTRRSDLYSNSLALGARYVF